MNDIVDLSKTDDVPDMPSRQVAEHADQVLARSFEIKAEEMSVLRQLPDPPEPHLGENDTAPHGNSLTLNSATPIAGLDLDTALMRVGGNKALYKSLLACFQRDNVDVVNRVRAAIEAGDLQRAREQTHSLKGVAGNLAMTDIFVTARDLEGQIKQGAVFNLPVLLQTLDQQIEQMLVIVKELLLEQPDQQVGVCEEDEDELHGDIAETTALLLALYECLVGHDMDAVMILAKLEKVLIQRCVQQDVVQLQDDVGRLQFESALIPLQAIARMLDIDLEGVS